MRCVLILAFVLIAPMVAQAQDDPQALAQQILDKGSKLFDTKDAPAMAATYTEDAVFVLVAKDNTTGKYKFEERRGRSEIEDFYRKLYEGQSGPILSKNTVESARLLAPDLLLIEGRFQPNVSQGLILPFVQMRVKQGDAWLMQSLHVFAVPGS
jgi:hypothetical protein